jgi:hypothetical protein
VRGFVELLRTTSALFTFEAQQTARIAGARLVVVLIAAALLLTGVALVVGSAALLVGSLMGETWMGFAVVGGSTVAIGAGTLAWAAHSLATRPDLRFPETRDQIRRDMTWLDQQLGSGSEKSSPD